MGRLNKGEYTQRDIDIVRLYTEEKLSCDNVSKIVNLNASSVHKRLIKLGVKTRSNSENSRKYYVNEHFFDTIDTENKAYWLGFIYADGYLTKTKYQKNIGIALGIKDKGHLEKYVLDLESNYPVNVYSATTNFAEYTYARVIVTSKVMHQDLLDKGVFENKSNILKFPDVSIVPEHLVHHFLRGYFDGDGSLVLTSKGNYSLAVCGTEDFLKGFCKMIGCKFRLEYRFEGNSGLYIRSFGNGAVKLLLDKLYSNATIYLERKHDRYLNLCESVAQENVRLKRFRELRNERKLFLKNNLGLTSIELGYVWNVSKVRANQIRKEILSGKYI